MTRTVRASSAWGTKSGLDAFAAHGGSSCRCCGAARVKGWLGWRESPHRDFRRRKGDLALCPRMKWVNYDSVSENDLSAPAMLRGRCPSPFLLDKAEVILALDADLLYSESGHLRHARAFAAGRTLAAPEAGMNRLYVVEPGMTLTGGAADHRFRLEAARIAPWAWALAAELGRLGLSAFAGFTSAAPLSEAGQRWVKAVAKDLMALRPERSHGRTGAAGRTSPPAFRFIWNWGTSAAPFSCADGARPSLQRAVEVATARWQPADHLWPCSGANPLY